MEEAFGYASDNSHGADPVPPNRAAIVALGVILGEEGVADVAKRTLDPERARAAAALRKTITLRARPDWSRHFWVSAALTVLIDEERSMTVGLMKEMMDSGPGQKGFSFSDLTADRAGTLFAIAATRDAESARRIQTLIRAGVQLEDYMPFAADLPERISGEVLQDEYGGLGGEVTTRVVEEIRRRLAECKGLR
ncbi:MAG: hypothetical protein GY711_17495 [bacterium]|nr:hypothetical protein [bacterium]